jgi:hypothetical protein
VRLAGGEGFKGLVARTTEDMTLSGRAGSIRAAGRTGQDVED